MPVHDPTDNLPLLEIFRAANELVAAGLIENYALGGALAAIYYVEPFSTYDADIFFIPKDTGLAAGSRRSMLVCKRKDGRLRENICLFVDFLFNFLPQPA